MEDNSPPPARKEDTLRVAAVQMNILLGDTRGNFARVLERLGEAASQGAKLVVFPECALSGYCFVNLEEAKPYAGLARCDYLYRDFSRACERHRVTGVLGFLEGVDREGTFQGPQDYAYCCNSAAVVVPPASEAEEDVQRYTYRKTHLPVLGVDRFVTPGRELPVYETPFGRLGVLICYDIRFPEAIRTLALQGADVVALPTNWPEGAESSPDFITRTRAWENRVFIVAANRVGIERGRRFIGRSQIVAPSGQILAEAPADEETILYGDIDLAEARQKRIVHEPGEWELDVLGGRRPELYGALVKDRVVE